MTWNTLPISSYFIPDTKRLTDAATTESNRNSSSARRQNAENVTIPFHIDRSENRDDEECQKTPIKEEPKENDLLVTPQKDDKEVPTALVTPAHLVTPANSKKQKQK